MNPHPHPHPRTVEDVIRDFKRRRTAIIKALTKNVDEFYQLCNPNLQNLCLYGFPDQQWEVNLPSPNSELPEPKLGINLVRDSMNKHQWLSMVALHSDAWLHSIASYYASKLKLDKADRKRLFNKISDICSVLEAITGESKKKEKKDIDGIFAEELLVEVLSRVQVRDLMKYRSVCKRWRSLIDDPLFVSTHLSNYKSNCEGSHLLIVEGHGFLHKDKQVLVRRSDTFRKVIELKHGLNEGPDSSIYILGYINGVMLIQQLRYSALDDYILWNPSINTSLNISNSASLNLRKAKFLELGLGFDALSNDLKVVAVVYPDAESSRWRRGRYYGTVPGLVQVYTVSTKSWNCYNGVHPPPYWSSGPHVFVNGGFHWMNLGPVIRDIDSWSQMRDSHMVSFDMSNGVFNYMELPGEVEEDYVGEKIKDKFPIVLDGSLGMFYHYATHYEVWVMEEYGVPNSWNKRYKFELQIDSILYFRSNGELLFALNGKGIKLYDAKRNWVRDLAKTYSRSTGYTIYTYVESLLLGCK